MASVTTNLLNRDILDSLKAIVGENNIVTDDSELAGYSMDQSPFPSIKPGIVIRPGTTQEISEMVSFCAKNKIPILPFGSGYSFSGLSNRAGSRALVLDLKRMRRVLQLNRNDLYVKSECGVIVGKLADKILSLGFYLNTVSVPYYKDTLGGMISGVIGGGIPQFSSSVGFNNRHTILGLKVVLPDGTIVETSGKGANTHGYEAHMRETNAPDMTGLFVSDGGIFGIKTEATLAIQPLPPEWDSSSWVFDGFDNALRAVLKVMESPQMLYDSITFHSPSISRAYLNNAKSSANSCGLVYYLHGFSKQDVSIRRSLAERIFRSSGARRGTKALDEFAARARTGQSFRNPSHFDETVLKRAACTYYTSKGNFRKTFTKIESLIKTGVSKTQAHGRDINSGYIVHPMLRNTIYGNHVMYYKREEDRDVVYRILKDSYDLAVREGAIMETHGGYSADAMGRAWSPEFKKLMVSIKRALDPTNTVNPKLWSM